MRICVLYQHYNNFDCPASARLYTLLQYLGKNHQIDLITTNSWRSLRITHDFPWVPQGVTLHEIPVSYDNAMSASRRLLSFVKFPTLAYRLAKTLPLPDVILGISTPLTTGLAADRLSKSTGRPWVFEIRDLWPDFPIQMGALKNRQLQKRAYALEEKLYRSASHTVTVSPDMTDHVLGYGIDNSRVSTLLQGTNPEFAGSVTGEEVKVLLDRYKLHGKKIVLYAGTFGRANGIPNLLRTAKLLNDEPGVHFVFLGHGYHQPEIQEQARDYNNITLAKPLPRFKIFPWFVAASITVVSFSDVPVLRTNSPAKFFDSLACGTPVVVTNPGWTKRFVEDHRCGWFVPAGDDAGLANFLRQALENDQLLSEFGNAGSKVASRKFDRLEIAKDFEGILLDCYRRAPASG